MEIRDVIHGAIRIEGAELKIIDSRYFQRLRQIRQLGFAEFSFPCATHSRYSHSLGTMNTATRAFDTIFSGGDLSHSNSSGSYAIPSLKQTSSDAFWRFRACIRMASLLHDVGHGPLSHTTEFAMPDLKKLSMPEILGSLGKQNRQATHEDYTLKILLDSDLTPLLEKFGKSYGLKPIHIASLIDPAIKIEDEFFNCDFQGHKKVNFRPVLSQIISSELDADRMDYLRRDSTHTGTSYGQFDFEWLVSNLTAHIKDSKCFMALEHKALYSFEDFLLSRFHMFLMVYFHYKSVIYDEMLKQYFQAKDCDYALPFAIDEYATCDDSHLLQHLKKSKNTWAKRIVEKRPYRMLIELHSGIPATKTSQTERARVLAKLEKDLSKKDVHYIVAKTTGELSKYFNKPKHPIWVRYDDHFSKPIFIPLEKCTDLFERYQEKRLITRLYVAPEFRAEFQAEGRLSSIQYEDLPG